MAPKRRKQAVNKLCKSPPKSVTGMQGGVDRVPPEDGALIIAQVLRDQFTGMFGPIQGVSGGPSVPPGQEGDVRGVRVVRKGRTGRRDPRGRLFARAVVDCIPTL